MKMIERDITTELYDRLKSFIPENEIDLREAYTRPHAFMADGSLRDGWIFDFKIGLGGEENFQMFLDSIGYVGWCGEALKYFCRDLRDTWSSLADAS